jgi:hypothetical protein
VKSCNEILDEITSRLPAHKASIKELYEESNSFRSLCEDYYDCKITLDKLNNSKKGEDIIRMEYEVIRREIEQELISRIILNNE